MMLCFRLVIAFVVLAGASAFQRRTSLLMRFQSGALAAKKALVTGLAVLSVASSCANAAADLTNYYKSDDGVISFKVPSDFVLSPKPLKTHAREVLYKSEATKGFNAGVTVDPVKISSIKEFTTPEGVGKKVVDVEKSKEGVFEADVVNAVETSTQVAANFPAYDIEYKIDSSRGKNHYLIRTTVVNKKLYVFTVQSKEDDYSNLEEVSKAIVESFKVDEPAS